MTMNWTLAGPYDSAALPATPYLARQALRRGMLFETAREAWPGHTLSGRPSPECLVLYTRRRHVPRDALFEDY